jgi:hypothetical protein
MKPLSETRTSQGGFRCGKYIWLQGTLKEKSIFNGLKHPHDVKAFGSRPLAACHFQWE